MCHEIDRKRTRMGSQVLFWLLTPRTFFVSSFLTVPHSPVTAGKIDKHVPEAFAPPQSFRSSLSLSHSSRPPATRILCRKQNVGKPRDESAKPRDYHSWPTPRDSSQQLLNYSLSDPNTGSTSRSNNTANALSTPLPFLFCPSLSLFDEPQSPSTTINLSIDRLLTDWRNSLWRESIFPRQRILGI